MTIAQQTAFPTLQAIMDLARSIVNDMYPGINGANGRILTNDAPFTLSYLNSAATIMTRKLRIGGMKFPVKDNVILSNIPALAAANPSIQTAIGFNGYFDGVQQHAQPQLPSDCLYVFEVEEQIVGSNLPFVPMRQPEGGLPSVMQGQRLAIWEWRQYQICMVGSLNAENLRIRYQSGQPPITAPAASFASTTMGVLDCGDAMANLVAKQYAQARGAADVTPLDAAANDAIEDMIAEDVLRAQTVTYRRKPYNGGGSNQEGSGTGIGQTSAGY